MLTVAGFAILLACVFGSYVLSGGSIGPLAEALAFELLTIGGATICRLFMANGMHAVKHTLAGMMKVVKGASFAKRDYVDLLCLLFHLMRIARSKGNVGLEPHIGRPEESDAFKKVPKLLTNYHATGIICDYLRMVGMNANDPSQIEDVLARELRKTLNGELHGAHAIQTIAHALPALGIVAAVLGVIKTMSLIDQPPAVLGQMIGGALAGVLLSYGLAGPIASRMKVVVEEESKFYAVIRAALIAHLHGNAPQVSVEAGRKMTPNEHMPSFQEVEEAVRQVRLRSDSGYARHCPPHA